MKSHFYPHILKRSTPLVHSLPITWPAHLFGFFQGLKWEEDVHRKIISVLLLDTGKEKKRKWRKLGENSKIVGKKMSSAAAAGR